jgi:hypothetical protein
MADDKKKVGKADRIRVSTTEKYELAHEAKKTGATRQQIKDAAKKVGPMRKDIEAELKKTAKKKSKA